MRRSPENLIEQAVQSFGDWTGQRAEACGVGPARVEILGNHTDYNGGHILAAAIDRHVVAVGRRIPERIVRARSLAFPDAVEFSLDGISSDSPASWGIYVRSVFAALRSPSSSPGGAELLMESDLPAGAGLGSSAALEVAVAMLLLQLYPQPIESLALARALQRGERDIVGVDCGLMDQFTSLHGRADAVVLLDCANGSYEALQLAAPPPAVVICDSRVSRRLRRDAPYDMRRRECEAARLRLGSLLQREVRGLCQISSRELREVGDQVPDPMLSRARHVIGEHERVIAAREFLLAGKIADIGKLMIESHASSCGDFENSCMELDRLCGLAADQPGYLGGRLCGAGWGGCTVSLVANGELDDFLVGMQRAITASCQDRLPELHVCHAAGGAYGRQLLDSA